MTQNSSQEMKIQNAIVQDYLEYNEENLKVVLSRLRELVLSNRFPKVTLSAVIEKGHIKKDKATISRWLKLRGSWTTITSFQHRRLIEWLVEDNLWYTEEMLKEIQEKDDYFYHAASAFLDMRQGTKLNLKQRLYGCFRVYYPSVLARGDYVVGAACMDFDEQTEALRASEFYQYEAEESEQFDFPVLHQDFEGYMIRKTKKYILFLRDSVKSHMRTTILPDVFRNSSSERKDEIVTMRGAFLGMAGNNGFFAPIYYAKVSGDNYEKTMEFMKSECGIYKRKKIPNIVLRHLDSIKATEFG